VPVTILAADSITATVNTAAAAAAADDDDDDDNDNDGGHTIHYAISENPLLYANCTIINL